MTQRKDILLKQQLKVTQRQQPCTLLLLDATGEKAPSRADLRHQEISGNHLLCRHPDNEMSASKNKATFPHGRVFSALHGDCWFN